MRALVSLTFAFVFGVAPVASAQSLSVNGSSTLTVRSADDFATTQIGDPWDFHEATDHVYMYSNGWQGVPAVSGGLLRGVVSGLPTVQMLFEGVNGAYNKVGKNGFVYPIDSGRYNRLVLRMKRPFVSADTMQVLVFHDSCRVGCAISGKMVATNGYFPDLGDPYVNRSPIAEQTRADRFHLFVIDLDRETVWSYGKWNLTGTVRGLAVRLGGDVTQPHLLNGQTVELDWMRLVPRGERTVTLSWSGFGGAVTLTATHAQTGDTIQIYPDVADQTTFADNRSFTWDYGFLPPGTWTVTARRSSTTRSATLVVDAAPVLHVVEPDASGGRDFSRTVVGDEWDMTNREDVYRHGAAWNVSNLEFGGAGLTGQSLNGDPAISVVDDIPRAPGTELVVDADAWHRLTFTIELDRKDLLGHEALGHWGSVARIVWRRAFNKYAPMTASQDIFVIDGGPHTFSFDLHAMTKAGGATCNDCDIENEDPNGGVDPWQGSMGVLRVDPHESDLQSRWFRLADVKLASDDEPNGNGFFTVTWRSFDATYRYGTFGPAQGSVSLYYDTDTNPANGMTLIASNVPASNERYSWNVAGVPTGRYWIYARITDSAGNTQARYSTGPVGLRQVYQPATDSNGNGLPNWWETKYGIGSPGGDADGDGVTNLEEYQLATDPRIPNTWVLPEGATGFFNERLALANPTDGPATVRVRYLRVPDSSGAVPPPIDRTYEILPFGRTTVDVNAVAGLADTAVSAVVTALTGAVIVERTMLWGDGWYGGHTGKGIQSPQTTWYLAEGATGDFDTYVLFANSNLTPASVTVEFLLQSATPEPPIVKTYTVPAQSRMTVFTNLVCETPAPGGGCAGRSLDLRSFSTVVRSNVPISVERAMYMSRHGRWFDVGHGAAGIATPSRHWFVAEGATGPLFDTYLLLGNPGEVPTQVDVRFLTPNEVITTSRTIQPKSRDTIWVNGEDGQGRLLSTDVSASISADQPIIVERAMYWPQGFGNWYEAHASAGISTTGTVWALAEGEHGGSRAFSTYILVANPSSSAARVRLTALRAGGRPPIVVELPDAVPANRRRTYHGSIFPGLESGEKFGVLVESIDEVPIVVERAMYWNTPTTFWGGGTNETAVKIR